MQGLRSRVLPAVYTAKQRSYIYRIIVFLLFLLSTQKGEQVIYPFRNQTRKTTVFLGCFGKGRTIQQIEGREKDIRQFSLSNIIWNQLASKISLWHCSIFILYLRAHALFTAASTRAQRCHGPFHRCEDLRCTLSFNGNIACLLRKDPGAFFPISSILHAFTRKGYPICVAIYTYRGNCLYSFRHVRSYLQLSQRVTDYGHPFTEAVGNSCGSVWCCQTVPRIATPSISSSFLPLKTAVRVLFHSLTC